MQSSRLEKKPQRENVERVPDAVLLRFLLAEIPVSKWSSANLDQGHRVDLFLAEADKIRSSVG
jgi:hypothetical protein